MNPKTKEGLKNQRVLVTGGAGFIGSELVRQLVVQDHQAVVMDNENEFVPKRNCT